MDSEDRDETKVRRRGEMLARRVGEALDQLTPNGAGECPDAEIIAAYTDQVLGAAESEKWEGHFATCARCRKILRVLAASADTPLAEKEVARLGELVSASRGPIEIRGRSAERARPRIVDWSRGWLAPAIGVAAVLAVWFAMRPPWRTTDRGVSPTLVAQAHKEEVPLSPAPAQLDRASRVAPQKDQITQATPPPARLSEKTGPENSPVGSIAERRAEAGNELKKSQSNDALAGSTPQKEEKFKNSVEGLEVINPASPVPPPPSPEVRAGQAMTAEALPPQARAQSKTPAPSAPEVADSTSQPVTVTESAPVVGATSGAPGGIQQELSADLALRARNYQALDKSRSAREFPALLKAASGLTLWRAGKDGIIERSTDAGKTWVLQVSPIQEDWLAGTAVSDTVCWLVGRNGAIARTVDGQHWERVAPPAQPADASSKLPDWTGVTAGDGQSATITASDGRRYATRDSGKTWQTQP